MNILFIAIAHSSHTISWLEMLSNKNINLNVYGINGSNQNYGTFNSFNFIEKKTSSR